MIYSINYSCQYISHPIHPIHPIHSMNDKVDKVNKVDKDKAKVSKNTLAKKGVIIEENDGLFDCSICYEIFIEPVTLVCGHTFCFHCLQRSITNKCPLCNGYIHDATKIKPNIILKQFLLNNANEDYIKRVEILKHKQLYEKYNSSKKLRNTIDDVIAYITKKKYIEYSELLVNLNIYSAILDDVLVRILSMNDTAFISFNGFIINCNYMRNFISKYKKEISTNSKLLLHMYATGNFSKSDIDAVVDQWKTDPELETFYCEFTSPYIDKMANDLEHNLIKCLIDTGENTDSLSAAGATFVEEN